MDDKIAQELLYGYDYHIRALHNNTNDYGCGYADAYGQVILDLARVTGDTSSEAYKRVMQFETVSKYVSKYPKAVKSTR